MIPTPNSVTIVVQYSCHKCGVIRANLEVPARKDEDVTDWMNHTVRLCGHDHRRRSPLCRSKMLSELKIPMAGTDRVGGPVIS